jgi:hypothetical protein
MPFTDLTKRFLDQLQRESGGTLVHVCCLCDPKPDLDKKSLILFNESCPVHGDTWHRLMVRHDGGRLELAAKLKKTS